MMQHYCTDMVDLQIRDLEGRVDELEEILQSQEIIEVRNGVWFNQGRYDVEQQLGQLCQVIGEYLQDMEGSLCLEQLAGHAMLKAAKDEAVAFLGRLADE